MVQVSLEGECISAFLPNPGRLSELLFPGVTLYLEPARGEGKYPYRVVGVDKQGDFVLLDTHRNNDVAEFLLTQGEVPGLEGQVVQREWKLGRSRIDFLLKQKGELVPLEVKSCTLFGSQVAMFPDAPSLRAVKHLEELASTEKAALLFLIHSPRVKYFLPEFHTDFLFSQKVLEVRGKIQFFALSLFWQEGRLHLPPRPVEIPWTILQRECQDQGSYLLLFTLRQEISLRIGKNLSHTFPKGSYLYVGSAMKGLSQRVKRHLRKKKKPHWHIDYLLPHAEEVRPLLIRSSERLECSLARELESLAKPIPRFGSSDCRCTSHLFYTPTPLWQTRPFWRLLEYYRMDRLG